MQNHENKYAFPSLNRIFVLILFAADFKGCLRVQAEMIPSNLIQIILA